MKKIAIICILAFAAGFAMPFMGEDNTCRLQHNQKGGEMISAPQFDDTDIPWSDERWIPLYGGYYKYDKYWLSYCANFCVNPVAPSESEVQYYLDYYSNSYEEYEYLRRRVVQ